VSNRTASQKLKTSSVTVVISLALVLFMLGLLGLVVINAKKLSNHIKENVGFQSGVKRYYHTSRVGYFKTRN
jgi:cell division transport system permease protein